MRKRFSQRTQKLPQQRGRKRRRRIARSGLWRWPGGWWRGRCDVIMKLINRDGNRRVTVAQCYAELWKTHSQYHTLKVSPNFREGEGRGGFRWETTVRILVLEKEKTHSHQEGDEVRFSRKEQKQKRLLSQQGRTQKNTSKDFISQKTVWRLTDYSHKNDEKATLAFYVSNNFNATMNPCRSKVH